MMKKILAPLLSLLLWSSAGASLFAQPDPGDAYFMDWGKRFNHAWMKLDTLAFEHLLSDDILITVCGQTGIEEQSKSDFLHRIKLGIAARYNGLIWGKSSPFFYAPDTLAIRRSKDGRTVWLLQNYYYKEEWLQNNRMVQDSGIISMQTTFLTSGGKWQPIAAFINVIPLKKTSSWACLSRAEDVSALEGKRFRLRAAVKTAVQDGGSANLWARVDKKNGDLGFFDNMNDRSITGKEWEVYTIEGKVDAGADSLYFGGCLTVPGTAWFDEFQLEVEESPGKWKPIFLQNGNIEAVDRSGRRPIAWVGNVFRLPNFSTAFATDSPFKGNNSFEISGKAEH